ncbi:MAG: Ig-like domain-containing protein [Gemmatimonadota bacterium]|nr:Ig-like domain-containing protein [Gemmatimonadota bacterium]
MSPPADTIALGDTLRLAAEAFDVNGHPVENAEFFWATSDEAVVGVNASGLVTGVGEGRATVTAMAGAASAGSEIMVENPDHAALVALYRATDGPSWIHSQNWLTDAPLAEWYGVEADAADRVVGLRLERNRLSGQLPPGLGDLSELRHLSLRGNRLTGPIPIELGGLTHLVSLNLGENGLTGEIPRNLGKLVNLEALWIFDTSITGEIPAELGLLAELRTLSLSRNELTGDVPPELGSLTNLRSELILSGNLLTGEMPASLVGLAVYRFFWFRNAGLCVPRTDAFTGWLSGIEDAIGPYCTGGDRAALESLYQAAGGSAWTNSTGWLSDHPLAEWYGVTADSLGRVVEIDLRANGLTGRLATTLGDLQYMTALRVGSNPGLVGPLPFGLSRLSLRDLAYDGTGLCAPMDKSFQAWLAALPSHVGTSEECALTDREVLTALYEQTNGPSWRISDNWLTEAPLADWYGITTDEDGRVVTLNLHSNGLAGRIPASIGHLTKLRELGLSGNNLGQIPPELGDLSDLRELSVPFSDLWGEIPPELGSLKRLEHLNLSGNQLHGEIPVEFGNLSELRHLWLSSLRLTGTIPRELGSLAKLQFLDLRDNRLSGQIPPTFGDMASLGRLSLLNNLLEGPLPPELSKLQNLRILRLQSNMLSGTVPAAWGEMTSLYELLLLGNPGLDGPLPASLTSLDLARFSVAGTSLCAPANASFLNWLESIEERRVPLCSSDGQIGPYLIQAAQSPDYPVPLVAGEKALLRVFVTAPRTTSETLPPVRASFFLAGTEVYVAEVPSGSATIPTEVREGNLGLSANVEIPGEVIRPGLEMVVEIDPGGTVDPSLGVSRRIPASGRQAVDVRTMPTLDLTAVPILSASDIDDNFIKAVEELNAGHDLFHLTHTLLPIEEIDFKVRAPLILSAEIFDRSTGAKLVALEAARVADGASGYYMGFPKGGAGLAFLRGRSSLVGLGARVIAHELGHNLSLLHAPCGRRDGLDPLYPHENGFTGVWGYDFVARALVTPFAGDVMGGGCRPQWISDYNFEKAMRFRLSLGGDGWGAAGTAGKTLLLWGGTDSIGSPVLYPSFVVDAPPVAPARDGPFEIVGRDSAGATLFSISFDMPEIADGDGSRGFAFALPTHPDWAATLDAITLSGPKGSATIHRSGDSVAAMLRDPATGHVRAIVEDWDRAAGRTIAELFPESVVHVSLSRGIPERAEWTTVTKR